MIGYVIFQDLDDNDKIINTYEDFGIILGQKQNPLPAIKTILVENEGGDGTIDLTEVDFAEVKYNDRVINYPFTLLDKYADLPSKISQVANAIHGKRFKIYHYDDLDHYYIGRVSIDQYSIDTATGSFVLKATCKPYKYKKNKTFIEFTVDGTETITLKNEKKRIVPKISASSTMQLEFEDTTFSISEGTYEYLNLYLKEGSNEVTITGTGTIRFEYQEASL